MTRQVSKPNIFWAPLLETARRIDDEDTVKSYRERPVSLRGQHGRSGTLQADCAPRSSRKLPRFTKAKPHNHKPLPGSRQGLFANRRSKWR
jgi:hypothetical protein